MAEGLLLHALAGQPEPLRSIKVVSAGLYARPGDYVSENSVIALRKVGIDINGHRARTLSQQMLDDALAVFCMTDAPRALIELQFAPVPRHLYLFRQFMLAAVDREIADPFGGPIKLYEACRDEMVEAVPGVISFLRTIAPARA